MKKRTGASSVDAVSQLEGRSEQLRFLPRELAEPGGAAAKPTAGPAKASSSSSGPLPCALEARVSRCPPAKIPCCPASPVPQSSPQRPIQATRCYLDYCETLPWHLPEGAAGQEVLEAIRGRGWKEEGVERAQALSGGPHCLPLAAAKPGLGRGSLDGKWLAVGLTSLPSLQCKGTSGCRKGSAAGNRWSTCVLERKGSKLSVVYLSVPRPLQRGSTSSLKKMSVE
ncbi:uncharacterized protein LOC106025064 isoform X1 [Cavia porcellus]|uniref:uncharacterized protein LOC106025064 isoform X1 n=1 Tax=Cavia porcellus TaxID=10141 RepID=UPI002FE2DAF7